MADERKDKPPVTYDGDDDIDSSKSRKLRDRPITGGRRGSGSSANTEENGGTRKGYQR